MTDFPITLAQGLAFCNRIDERRQLTQFIEANRHTVLIAPRRYGKTSLIVQSLAEIKIPHTIMELALFKPNLSTITKELFDLLIP